MREAATRHLPLALPSRSKFYSNAVVPVDGQLLRKEADSIRPKAGTEVAELETPDRTLAVWSVLRTIQASNSM